VSGQQDRVLAIQCDVLLSDDVDRYPCSVFRNSKIAHHFVVFHGNWIWFGQSGNRRDCPRIGREERPPGWLNIASGTEQQVMIVEKDQATNGQNRWKGHFAHSLSI